MHVRGQERCALQRSTRVYFLPIAVCAVPVQLVALALQSVAVSSQCIAPVTVTFIVVAGICLEGGGTGLDFAAAEAPSCRHPFLTTGTMDSPVLYTTLNAQYGLTTGAVARYDPATDAENLKFALAEWVNATTLTSQVDSYNIRIVSVAAGLRQPHDAFSNHGGGCSGL